MGEFNDETPGAAGLLHEGVGGTGDVSDERVAPAFKLVRREALVPELKKGFLALCQTQMIALGHIEVGSCHDAAREVRGLHAPAAAVDHGRAAPVHAGGGIPFAVAVIAAVGIDLADGRVEVVQVAFQALEIAVGGRAVFACAESSFRSVL